MKDLKLVIMFGSRARGTHSPRSDYDLAVLGDHLLTLAERQEIIIMLAQKLKANEDTLDLVDLWDTSPLLQRLVAEEGKLLQGTPEDFIRFRVLAWKRYVDTAKFRRARDSALKTHRV